MIWCVRVLDANTIVDRFMLNTVLSVYRLQCYVLTVLEFDNDAVQECVSKAQDSNGPAQGDFSNSTTGLVMGENVLHHEHDDDDNGDVTKSTASIKQPTSLGKFYH